MKMSITDLKFHTTPFERSVIKEIADRAMRDLQLARQGGDRFTLMDIHMDVAATHCNGCPLRLDALRDADPFNFAHDILGIRRNLNRETGKLENSFSPRFACRA